jgi:hypothetical protein
VLLMIGIAEIPICVSRNSFLFTIEAIQSFWKRNGKSYEKFIAHYSYI